MFKFFLAALGVTISAFVQNGTFFDVRRLGLDGVDNSIRPGDDFYRYANGNWLRRTQISDDRMSVGSYDDLRLLSERRMLELMNDLRSRPGESLDPDQTRLVAFYGAVIDRTTIEARGLQPIKAGLARIKRAVTLEDIATLMGDPGLDLPGPFAIQIQIDEQNSNVYVPTIAQSGLTLPRDAYVV